MSRFNFLDMNLRSLIITLVALLLTHTVAAQRITIKRMEQTPEEMIIYYDLESNENAGEYHIQLFSSKDNFLAPLAKVLGDIGIAIRPGINRRISWNAKAEWGNTFKGDLQLEIHGKVYAPFIKVTNLDNGRVIKRAKATTLTWTGDTNNNMLTFSLFRNEELINVFSSMPNIGKAVLSLPHKVKPGGGYYFMIAEPGVKEHQIKTEEFTVKTRYPLVAKIGTAIAVAGIVILLLPEKPPDTVGLPLNPPSPN